MASHGVSWVLGAHVRFGNLDFIVTTEGKLAQVLAAVQPLHVGKVGAGSRRRLAIQHCSDMIVEVLEEL